MNSAVRELLKNDPKGLAQTVRKYLKRAERVQAVAESLSRCAMEEGEYERGILGGDLPRPKLLSSSSSSVRLS